MWYQFPKDNETYTLNEQFMIGESLMVCPVTVQDDTETNTAITVYFPSGTWFVNQLPVWGGIFFPPIIVHYIINLMYTHGFYRYDYYNGDCVHSGQGDSAVVTTGLNHLNMFVVNSSVFVTQV